jgi:hypothetical protein
MVKAQGKTIKRCQAMIDELRANQDMAKILWDIRAWAMSLENRSPLCNKNILSDVSWVFESVVWFELWCDSCFIIMLMCELDFLLWVLGIVGMSTSFIFKNKKFISQGNNSWVWYCYVSVLAIFRSSLQCFCYGSKTVRATFMKFLWEKLGLSTFQMPLESPFYLI